MSNLEVTDQAGFINAVFPNGDPFHPSRFPEGSEVRVYMQKMHDKNKGGFESSYSLFIDLSKT